MLTTVIAPHTPVAHGGNPQDPALAPLNPLPTCGATVYTQVEKSLIFHSSLVYLEHKLYMGMLLVEAEPPIWH